LKIIKGIKEKLNIALNMDIEKEEERTHMQFMIVLIVLCAVSYFMTFLNFLTDWFALGVITCSFGVLTALDALIELKAKTYKVQMFARIAFIVETMMMFVAFLISGEPEGFAALWALLLPSCGFLLFRMKYGTIICSIQWLILAILLWTPIGDMFFRYEYTQTFHQRFPIIFFAFGVVGALLELVRQKASEQLREEQEKYQYLYLHDSLTGLYNRYGFVQTFDEIKEERNGREFAFGVMDLDHFKNVNDKYGHLNGDEVLRQVGQNVKKFFGDDAIVSRWGGEEFSILIKELTCEEALKKCEELLEHARVTPLKLLDGTDLIITFSLGVTLVSENEEFSSTKLFKYADDNLYEAKQTGRNRIVVRTYYGQSHEGDGDSK